MLADMLQNVLLKDVQEFGLGYVKIAWERDFINRFNCVGVVNIRISEQLLNFIDLMRPKNCDSLIMICFYFLLSVS